jgi:hypothetical protein
MQPDWVILVVYDDISSKILHLAPEGFPALNNGRKPTPAPFRENAKASMDSLPLLQSFLQHNLRMFSLQKGFYLS